MAKSLVVDAIQAGIFNDLGSGSNVDLCIVRCICRLARRLLRNGQCLVHPNLSVRLTAMYVLYRLEPTEWNTCAIT